MVRSFLQCKRIFSEWTLVHKQAIYLWWTCHKYLSVSRIAGGGLLFPGERTDVVKNHSTISFLVLPLALCGIVMILFYVVKVA